MEHAARLIVSTTHTTQAAAPTTVDACVILAGGIKPSLLEKHAQQSVLDLWLGSRGTVLESWLQVLTPLLSAEAIVQIVHAKSRPPANQSTQGRGINIRWLPEEGVYRGPAGVVRDCCQDLPPDSTILVAEAARWATIDVLPLLKTHRERHAMTTVCINPDQSPAGLYLVQNAALEIVPKKGFMDIKEQWLPRVQQQVGNVFVYRVPAPGLQQLRTVPQALSASCSETKDHSIHHNGERVRHSAVAPDARIDASAAIVNSIIMPGATVEADAVVVRSIICHGAVVPMGTQILDAVYTTKPAIGGS